MKLCKDCVFFHERPGFSPVCLKLSDYKKDPVFGDPMINDPVMCKRGRESGGKCGPRAKFFDPKDDSE